MSKRLRTSVFLVLGVLIFVFVLAGCSKTPVVKASCIKADNSPFTAMKSTKEIVRNVDELSIDDISLDYYGEYEGCYAVLITINVYDDGDVYSPQNFGNGITIHYSTRNYIMAWTDQSVEPGKLYTLREALALSLLTMDDIRQIANCNNNGLKPEKPLDDAIATKIKETRAAECRAFVDVDGICLNPDASAEDVFIRKYCGEYNGCYVIMLEDRFSTYPQAPWTDIVDGVEIIYGDGNYLMVWTEKL